MPQAPLWCDLKVAERVYPLFSKVFAACLPRQQKFIPLVVQWVRHCPSSTGSAGSILGVKWKSCPTLCDPMDYIVHGILQAGILHTGVGRCSILQGIFPTQGLNPGLPHRRQILYHLSHQGSPQSLVGELKFHMPHGVAQKIPKTKHIKNHSEGFASLEDSFQNAKPQEGREGKLTFIKHLKCGWILTHKIDNTLQIALLDFPFK